MMSGTGPEWPQTRGTFTAAAGTWYRQRLPVLFKIYSATFHVLQMRRSLANNQPDAGTGNTTVPKAVYQRSYFV
jgi:hypothetical protein